MTAKTIDLHELARVAVQPDGDYVRADDRGNLRAIATTDHGREIAFVFNSN